MQIALYSLTQNYMQVILITWSLITYQFKHQINDSPLQCSYSLMEGYSINNKLKLLYLLTKKNVAVQTSQ